MQSAEISELKQSTLARIDEESFFDDAVQMESSRSDPEEFLKTLDIADNFTVVVGYKNSKDSVPEGSEKVIGNLGDQRKCCKVWID